jgi:hypothetical protein
MGRFERSAPAVRLAGTAGTAGCIVALIAL